MKKFLSLILTLAMVLSLVTVPAFADTVAVTGVTLNKDSTELFVNATETLTATVAPVEATNKTVTWSSSNDAVATVADGVVTAVAAGTATITVTTADQSMTATCTVTVADKYELTVTPTTKTIYFNDADENRTFTITPTLKKNNQLDETTNVTYTPSNETVTVSAAGVVTIPTTVTTDFTVSVAATNYTSATVNVTVKDRYEAKLASGAEAVSVTIGNTKTLTAPTLFDNVSNTTVSSSEYSVAYSVASTDPAGCVTLANSTVTGVAAGTATITATITHTASAKTYTKNYTVTAEKAKPALTLGAVDNGDYTYLYVSDLKSAAVSALKSAVPAYAGAGTVTSLTVSSNAVTGGKLYKQDGTTDVTSSDNLVDSAISYTRFDATAGYLGNVTYAVTVVIDSETYNGTMVIPVAADYANISDEVEATENTSGTWSFSFPTSYDTIFYAKTLPTAGYDGYFTSTTSTPTGWTKAGSTLTLNNSEFNSSGECKLYVVTLDDGVASTGTLTVTQVFNGIEYSGKIDEKIAFDENDFDEFIEDAAGITSKSKASVELVNVVFTKPSSSYVTLYDNGTKITDSKTKCTDLDKVYLTATKAGTYDLSFTANAKYYSGSTVTTGTAKEYKGVVRVTVYKDGDITYEVDAGKTVTFNEDDFDKFYTKDTLSYVVFGTPSAGTLYETSTCKTETKSTKFYFEATKSQDDLDTVTFKADKTPFTEYSVYIPFTAYAKNGTKSSDGVVEIIVNGSMPFTDVLESNTFYSYIKYCYRENIMQGKTATLFKPTEPVTRAQLVVTLYRMANSPTTYNSNTMSFTDCKTLSTEFQNAIKWGVAKKLINGYGNTFKPNDSITRQAMVTILYRFGTNLGYIDGYGVTGNLNSFSDAAKISASMKDAVAWAVGAGLVSGNNGKFNPAGTTTRGACAKILAGFHETYVG